MGEIVAAALGIVGKLAAKPAAEAALRNERVVQALKKLRLDPHVPPQDFDSLYAYTLVEYCANQSPSVLAVFRDEYVHEALRRSFDTADGWQRLRDEVLTAVERNRETGEFGHLDHGFLQTHVDGFTAAFQDLVDRSRAPHETRLEQKVDALLEQVSRTRDMEETHRDRVEPGRAILSPAERLMRDVSDWFVAVGYEIRRTWETRDDTVALLVDVPQRRPGRFDRTVMLCVEGELAPHHLVVLDELVESEKAGEGWGLARTRVSKAARQRAADSDDRLFCYTFDELVELEADFEPYIAWVEDEVRRRGIDTRYVPLSCHKDELDPTTQQPLDTSVYDWREGGLDDYVAGWLEDPAKKHLSLLGEFGMGKSWFALHLAGEMARGWRDARRRGVPRPRIPLLIPLRDYAKQTSVEALLSEFFFNKHKIALRSYDVFRVLNRMGRILLIFDGFDEMAARVDHNTVVANFWELAKAVEPGAKVLLSSRTEHFPDAQVARELFGAKASASTRREDGPTFEIVELVPFDDEQIERMLSHDLDEDKIRTIMGNDEVRDLMRRPVMSELVIDALPEIERGAEIDLARIYLYAIQRKMDRDIKAERTFTSRGDKVFFLCEVAWEMLSSDRLTLNYRDFPDRLRACFGPEVQSAKALDYWEQDMRNQGMLVRNAEGDYGPSHKSLLEFLVAFKFAAELGLLGGDFLEMIPGAGHADGEPLTWSEYFRSRGADGSFPPLASFATETLTTLGDNFGSLGRNDVVYRFLAAMARHHPDARGHLLAVVAMTKETSTAEAPRRLAGHCANLLLAAGVTLEGTDLSDLDLAGFAPHSVVDRPTLAGAVLRGANLAHADLADVDLSGADLTGAQLNWGMLNDTTFDGEGLAHASGAIAVCNEDEVRYWPDGVLSGEATRIPLGSGSQSFVSVAQWDEDAWAYLDGGSWGVVDVRSGPRGMTVSTGIGHPIRWRGRTLLGEWEPDRLRIVDPVSGEVVETVLDPEGDDVHRQHYYIAGSAGPSIVSAQRTGLRYLVCDGDAPEPWRTVAEARLDFDLDWMVRGDDSMLLAAGTRFFGAIDISATYAVLSEEGWPLPDLPLDKAARVVVRAASGMAAVVTEADVYVWSLSASLQARPWEEVERIWQIRDVPTGVVDMWSPPTGDRLVILTGMGELTVHDFRTGEVLSRTMLTTRLKGTRFSRNSAFDESTLDAIARAGGVIVD
jgi:hypothetical protein